MEKTITAQSLIVDYWVIRLPDNPLSFRVKFVEHIDEDDTRNLASIAVHLEEKHFDWDYSSGKPALVNALEKFGYSRTGCQE